MNQSGRQTSRFQHSSHSSADLATIGQRGANRMISDLKDRTRLMTNRQPMGTIRRLFRDLFRRGNTKNPSGSCGLENSVSSMT